MTSLHIEHEGQSLAGELGLPDGDGPFPAVMIMHSGLGIGDNEHAAAARLKALGYATLLADMYGEAFQGGVAEAGACYEDFLHNPAKIRSRSKVWFEALAADDAIDASRIAAIGYCFGGTCVLELARSGADVKACVSLHGILSTHAPAQAGTIKAEVSAWCGEDDPFSPPAQLEDFRAEMRAAGVRCQVTVFGQVAHGFTDPAADALGREGISYDAVADAVSWAGTVALLGKALA